MLTYFLHPQMTQTRLGHGLSDFDGPLNACLKGWTWDLPALHAAFQVELLVDAAIFGVQSQA